MTRTAEKAMADLAVERIQALAGALEDIRGRLEKRSGYAVALTDTRRLLDGSDARGTALEGVEREALAAVHDGLATAFDHLASQRTGRETLAKHAVRRAWLASGEAVNHVQDRLARAVDLADSLGRPLSREDVHTFHLDIPAGYPLRFIRDRVKAVGGRYTTTRGGRPTRRVSIPATGEGRDLLDWVLVNVQAVTLILETVPAIPVDVRAFQTPHLLVEGREDILAETPADFILARFEGRAREYAAREAVPGMALEAPGGARGPGDPVATEITVDGLGDAEGIR